MGIPKFFRLIRFPEFDNLYLDMNGIIHHCSRLNDVDVYSEDNIFINIFDYISGLFTEIKPKKLFFIAIDGVAPRAKVNEQRARRFRTSAVAARKAEAKGEESPFDFNCITPGTEFMSTLSLQLQHFINKKVTEELNWRDVKIVLSGHDVPGEGEHKIIEYIRNSKAQEGYNPNIRHCLYGLDADLIVLGLLSHEPHFALLREEKKQERIGFQNFYLMHLSLLREYIDLEFSDLKNTITFYDLERIIDDFILLTLFVGNDFLPRLLNSITEFRLVLHVYKKALPDAGGYINDGGKLHMERLEIIFKAMCGELKVSKFNKREYQKQGEVICSYIKGLKWVLHYYYEGVKSWGWFYPYRFPPKTTNLRDLDKFNDIEFELGSPFMPFEQLMSVLPEGSKKLVPEPYQDLMTNPDSPIIDFYKKQDGESIPFINQERLIAALKAKEGQLTESEKQRNTFGESFLFTYDPNLNEVYSSHSSLLPDIEDCKCRTNIYHLPTLDGLKLIKGLCDGVQLGMAGFPSLPSLKTLSHTEDLLQHEVNIFNLENSESKMNETMVITILNQFENMKTEDIAHEKVGKRVFVDWPFLKEGFVQAISDELCRYEFCQGQTQFKINPHRPEELEQWRQRADKCEQDYKKCGTITGLVNVVAHVLLLKDGTLVGEELDYAIQTIVDRY